MTLGIVFVAVPPLRAQEQPPTPAPQAGPGKERAQALVLEASRLYFDGEYVAALDKVTAAYAAFPSSKLHYNFALVHRGLGQDVKALDSFEHFLAETDAADAELGERREQAKKNIAELLTRVGIIEVAANIGGADVLVDGQTAGTTPLRSPIRVRPGVHQVVVQKSAFGLPYVDQVTITGGERMRVYAQLVPFIQVAPPLNRQPDAPPFYKRWWFWTVTITLVGAAIAVPLVLQQRGNQTFCPEPCRGTENL